MDIKYYLNHIDLTDILIGIIFALLLILIVILIIYSYRLKIKKSFSDIEFSPLRILENFEGMAFNCSIDQHWTMNYVSSNAYKVIGYTNEEVTNNNMVAYQDIIHPKFRKFVRDKYEDAIATHQDVNIEYKIITKQGKERWVAEEANIIYDHLGKAIYIDGFIFDIHYRKELLLEKNQFKFRYQSLMDGLDFPLLVIREGLIIEANPAAINFFRANLVNDIIGHSALEFIDEHYHDFYIK